MQSVSTSAVVNQLVELAPANPNPNPNPTPTPNPNPTPTPNPTPKPDQVELSPAEALQQCQAHVGELKRELAMHDQLAHRSAVQYAP